MAIYDTTAVEKFLKALRGITVRGWESIFSRNPTHDRKWLEAKSEAFILAQRAGCESDLMARLVSLGSVWKRVFETDDGLAFAFGATLGLAMRSALTEEEFEILYKPFKGLVPLERRADVHSVE